MAYNPNVPAPTNRVQDDIAAMRGNFQHLAPLAQLAPVASGLQTVSGLAPYVQALLSSRIVEMGSNSNGEYVRWENGLQVCWMNSVRLMFNSTVNLIAVWTFPAAFIEAPTVSHHTHDSLPQGNAKRIGLLHTSRRTGTSVDLEYYNGNGPFVDGDVVNTQPFAIGRWK